MKSEELEKIETNLQEIKRDSAAIYAKQNSQREAFLNAPENQEKIREIEASLKAAQIAYEMRKKAGLTQAEIARKLHIKQPNYARIERGQNITVNTLAGIAQVCGAELNIGYRIKKASHKSNENKKRTLVTV